MEVATAALSTRAAAATATIAIDWNNSRTWRQASKNAAWCLLGRVIGDFGTIAFFQFTGVPWSTLAIMALATFNGLVTSIVILARQTELRTAFRTAIGMSFIAMMAMETMMNAVGWVLTGGAELTWRVVPVMLAVGFLTPLPYNYWRLKALGRTCR